MSEVAALLSKALVEGEGGMAQGMFFVITTFHFDIAVQITTFIINSDRWNHYIIYIMHIITFYQVNRINRWLLFPVHSLLKLIYTKIGLSFCCHTNFDSAHISVCPVDECHTSVGGRRDLEQHLRFVKKN